MGQANTTQGNNETDNINIPDFSDQYKFRDYVRSEKDKGISVDDLKSKIRKTWAKSMKGTVEPEFFNIVDIVYHGFDPDKLDRIASEGLDKKKKLFDYLQGDFFSNSQGIKFYVEPDGIPIEIESDQFDGILSDLRYRNEGELPSSDEINKVKRYARFLASKSTNDLGVRAAKYEDGFIYDPIRPDGMLYFISRSGNELRKPDIPYTVRYSGMLEAPIRDGTLQDHLELIRLWHLGDKGEILSLGLDFSRFIPDIPHAIESIDGSHGAGKTSYTETKRMIFDPNGAPTQSLKFDERDLSISAIHQGMLAFDNVNTAMPDYISDIVCRLTTGQGFRTRELYTNMGEVILKIKKSILINGINRASYKPDFIDRECPMHLGIMPESRRLTDAEIRAKAEMLIPKVRGFILSIMPEAVTLYSQVEAELKGKLPRMADFVIWAECGIRAMGFKPMSFFDAYTEAKHREIADVAMDTLLVNAIQGLMAGQDEWIGPSKDLLIDLEHHVTPSQLKSKGFPKDPRRLGRELNSLEPTLREIGIVIEELSDGKRTKRIRKIDQDIKSPESNVSNVSLQIEPTKNDVSKLTLGTDINFSKKSNVSDTEAVKHIIQSETDNTDIKNGNFLQEYASVEIVLKALKDWKLEVMEYDNVMYSPGTWKAKLKGRLDSHTKEQQDFLNGFTVKFAGSINADFTWIHFNVRSRL